MGDRRRDMSPEERRLEDIEGSLNSIALTLVDIPPGRPRCDAECGVVPNQLFRLGPSDLFRGDPTDAQRSAWVCSVSCAYRLGAQDREEHLRSLPPPPARAGTQG